MADIALLLCQLSRLEAEIVRCMKCGMCQAVCPMYATSLLESDVARGKIALIDTLAHAMLDDVRAVEEKLNRCLLCGSCQANCPSGVHILDIFFRARAAVAAYRGLHPLKKCIFRYMLAKASVFAWSVRLGTPWQKLFFKPTGNIQQTSYAPLLRPLIGNRHMRTIPTQCFLQDDEQSAQTHTKRSLRVLLFAGCLGNTLFTRVTQACMKALRYHGVTVVLPKGLVCCGMPALASGDVQGMLVQTQANMDVLAKTSCDYILTPCSSCTASIKEHWPTYMQEHDASQAEYAREVAAKVMDINAFLVDVLHVTPHTPSAETAQRITYHESCHLKKSLHVSTQPRTLITCNPAYTLVEMDNPDSCCGSGGSFTLFHYPLSLRIGTQKRARILATKASVVAAACPACMLQLEDILSQNNDPITVQHTIEIYAASLPY